MKNELRAYRRCGIFDYGFILRQRTVVALGGMRNERLEVASNHAMKHRVCCVMVVGAGIGGYGGAWYAQRLDPKRVRWIVIAVGCVMTLYFAPKTA